MSALADDVLQEAYYRLLRADMKDAAIGQVRCYLYKTARTLVVDHGRTIGSGAQAATEMELVDFGEPAA